jgi:hypothetical protein
LNIFKKLLVNYHPQRRWLENCALKGATILFAVFSCIGRSVVLPSLYPYSFVVSHTGFCSNPSALQNILVTINAVRYITFLPSPVFGKVSTIASLSDIPSLLLLRTLAVSTSQAVYDQD